MASILCKTQKFSGALDMFTIRKCLLKRNRPNDCCVCRKFREGSLPTGIAMQVISKSLLSSKILKSNCRSSHITPYIHVTHSACKMTSESGFNIKLNFFLIKFLKQFVISVSVPSTKFFFFESDLRKVAKYTLLLLNQFDCKTRLKSTCTATFACTDEMHPFSIVNASFSRADCRRHLNSCFAGKGFS